MTSATKKVVYAALCGNLLVARYGYAIRAYHLTSDGRCPSCGTPVPGRWSDRFDPQMTSRPFAPGGRRLTILSS